MTTEEVAELLQVGVRTLKRWRMEGTGPKFAKTGRQVRYDRADVVRWFERQQALSA